MIAVSIGCAQNPNATDVQRQDGDPEAAQLDAGVDLLQGDAPRIDAPDVAPNRDANDERLDASTPTDVTPDAATARDGDITDGTTDAGDAFVPLRIGYVSATAATGYGSGIGEVQTTFFADIVETYAGCGRCVRREGACVIATVDSVTSPFVDHLSAGTLTVSGGSMAAVSIDPFAGYYLGTSEPGAHWMPGDRLTITAMGDAIPAFAGSVTMPSALSIMSPRPDASGRITVDRTTGFSVAWSASATGYVLVEIFQQMGSTTAYVTCDFARSAGTATIAASMLTGFVAGPAGAMQHVSVLAEDYVDVSAGGFTVRLSAAGDGYIAPATIR